MKSIRDAIERHFGKLADLLYRHRLKTLLVAAAVVAAMASQLPKLEMDVSTEGFLHKNDPTLQTYNAFRDQFGRDELILVAIETGEVFDFTFLDKLRRLHTELEAQVPYLEDITSLINARDTRGRGDALIVEDLMENWPESPAGLATLRRRVFANPIYRNLLISEDGRFTTIMIQTQTYSPAGEKTDVLEGFEAPGIDADLALGEPGRSRPYLTDAENSEAVRAVRRIVAGYDGPQFKTYITGSAAVTHFIKQAMMQDIRKFLALAFLTVSAFLFVMFRRLSGVLLPLLVVILSLLSTVGLMAAFGVPIKLPTQVLPSFMLAVSVGYSVHILAIFFHRLRAADAKREAVVYAIGHSGLAILMTAATTAGGLFSFSTSQVAPIADLGRFAGAGVLLAMVYTIVLLPALLALVPLRGRAAPEAATPEPGRMDRVLAGVGRFATGHPVKILVATALLLAASLFGIRQIRFSHDPLRWLPPQEPVRVATETIDEALRGSLSLEVVCDTGITNGLYDPDLLGRLDDSARFLEGLQVGEVFAGKAWSITTILKETHQALNENRPDFYRIPRDRQLIAQELLLFENSGSDDLEDFTDSQLSKARLMIKVPFRNATAYSRFLERMHAHFERNYAAGWITVTGMTALLFRTLTNAIDSMARSYIYALVVITVLMILLIGRLRIGLLSMIPNLTPILIALGVMGFFDLPMNLFTMLVGNIAIGLAVDDTIHFMHNYRRYYEQSGDSRWAVMETLHTAGRAMLVTSCVLSIGFFIFMFARMQNLIHFGLLTGLTIVMALLADFFIAPALMVTVHRRHAALPAATALTAPGKTEAETTDGSN